MGLSSTTNRAIFTGDGSSTIFSFPYYFFSPSDLAVYLFDTNSSVIIPQVLNTNFTVSGSQTSQGTYPQGGAVVMNSAFPSNLELIVTRSPSQVQNFTLAQNSPINAVAITQQFDYLTALVQRLQDEVSRCIQLPDGLGMVGGNAFNPILPQSVALISSSANLALTLNSSANGWVFSATGGGGGGGGGSVTFPIPISQGGTGQTTGGTALVALAGGSTSAQFLRGNGLTIVLSAIQASDVPTLNQNTTGTAQSLSSILAINLGGTGQASATAAANALLPTQSSFSNKFLKTDGGGSLSWDITSSVTYPVSVALGGTGQTTAVAAINALLPAQPGHANLYLQTNGSTAAWAAATSVAAVSFRGTGYTLNFGTGSSVIVAWQAVSFDSASAYSAGTWTCPTTGVYFVSSQMVLDDTAGAHGTTDRFSLQIVKNGSVYSEGYSATVWQAAGTHMTATVSDTLSLTAGDTVAIQVANNCVQTINFTALDTIHCSITSAAGGSSGSGVTSVGALDSATPSANGLVVASSTILVAQSATATNPGLINSSAQVFSGVKTFMSPPVMSSLTASAALVLDSGKNLSSSTNIPLATIGITIDGGGTTPTTGVKGFISIPYAATINSVTLMADVSGSIVIDLWKAAFGSFPPTQANTICASSLPSISSAQSHQDTTLSGWNTSISAGDVIAFSCSSATTLTRANLVLKVTKV